MISSPLVSIITPTYNHQNFIGPCIESVLCQTYPNWEQIIVDDGSTDGTADVIGRYSHPRILYLHQSHQGADALAHTYNRGLARASGELIAILEGDDLWPANKLAALVPAFEESTVALAYGAVGELSANGSWGGKLGRSVRNRRKLSRSILFNNPVRSATPYILRADAQDLIPASTVVMRRSALEGIGGFQYVSGLCVTDYPTFARLSLIGTFFYLPEVMGYRRRHLGSVTFQNLTKIARGAEVYAYWLVEESGLDLTGLEREQIQRTWRLSRCDREFTAGRICLVNQDWHQARVHFRQALNPLLIRIAAAAVTGWCLSWFHADLENVMRLAGRPVLRERGA